LDRYAGHLGRGLDAPDTGALDLRRLRGRDCDAHLSVRDTTRPGTVERHLVLVVAGPDHHCTATWGGAYTLDQATSRLDLDRRMSQLRLVGGQARVSFGGQAGSELASTCTDPMALREAYQSVVDRYELTSIDLDIQGASLEDTAAATRRAAAIKNVQDHVRTAGRNLAVWLTLPVSPTGLTASGAPVLARMLSAGVDLAGSTGWRWTSAQ